MPTSLQMCGVLAAVAEAEPRIIGDTHGIADSVTSKHPEGHARLRQPRG